MDMGVSENVVYPIVPNGFADHYPYEKWLFHWEYTLFSDKPICLDLLGQRDRQHFGLSEMGYRIPSTG